MKKIAPTGVMIMFAILDFGRLAGRPTVRPAEPAGALTYLLVSLAGVAFGDHQTFTFRRAVVTCAVPFAAARSSACSRWWRRVS